MTRPLTQSLRLDLTSWAAVTFFAGFMATIAALALTQSTLLVGAWVLWMAFPTAAEPLGRAVARAFAPFRRWLSYGHVTEVDLSRDTPVVVWASRMGAVSAYVMIVTLQSGVPLALANGLG
ncbi:MAG: hypothetical protein AAFY65_09065 [Pseudomonadota bacterium]